MNEKYEAILARREQAAQPEAQHAPAALGVQGEYDALTAARRVAVNVAAERDRLAAENERLREANDEQARRYLAVFDAWDAAARVARERGEKRVEALREVERLRGLLASLASAAERVLVILTARFQNDYRANGMTDEGALETAQGLTIITGLRETIEAAKEAAHANL